MLNHIGNAMEMHAFLERVYDFHDCLLKEVRLLHPGYVDQDGQMFLDGELCNAQLFFQSQFVSEVPPFVIHAMKISKFYIVGPQSPFEEICGEIVGDEFILSDQDDVTSNFYLRCSALSFEFLS